MNHMEAVSTFASERYLLDEMPELQRHAFEHHYFTCVACAEDVRLGALMREAAGAGFAATPRSRVTARATSASPEPPGSAWYRSSALPWATAATLAILVGYQSFIAVPALAPLMAPQALSPVTLRPSARGAEPIVTLRPGAAVALAVELNAPGATAELVYDLATADGRRVAGGRAPLPGAGAPLLLLLPALSLSAEAPGRYVLSVHDAASGLPIGEYRFSAVATE